MKSLIVKDSEPNEPVTLGKSWLRTVVLISALLLPAGALAQSTPLAEEDYPQQETEIYEQQDVYQEQGGAPVEEDYSNNPYQQPVMTEFEQDQLDQAQKSLGLPDSRRPEFNNFFDAEERAIRSKEEMLQNQQNQEFGF